MFSLGWSWVVCVILLVMLFAVSVFVLFAFVYFCFVLPDLVRYLSCSCFECGSFGCLLSCCMGCLLYVHGIVCFCLRLFFFTFVPSFLLFCFHSFVSFPSYRVIFIVCLLLFTFVYVVFWSLFPVFFTSLLLFLFLLLSYCLGFVYYIYISAVCLVYTC